MDEDRLLTTDEVAAFLGIPKGTLFRWNSQGTGPEYFRVGKHCRWTKQAVVEWLEENRASAA